MYLAPALATVFVFQVAIHWQAWYSLYKARVRHSFAIWCFSSYPLVKYIHLKPFWPVIKSRVSKETHSHSSIWLFLNITKPISRFFKVTKVTGKTRGLYFHHACRLTQTVTFQYKIRGCSLHQAQLRNVFSAFHWPVVVGGSFVVLLDLAIVSPGTMNSSLKLFVRCEQANKRISETGNIAFLIEQRACSYKKFPYNGQ